MDFTCHPKCETHEDRNCVCYLCIFSPNMKAISYYVHNKWLINEWKNASSPPRPGPFLFLSVLSEENKGKSLLFDHFSSPVTTCLIWEAYTAAGIGKGARYTLERSQTFPHS